MLIINHSKEKEMKASHKPVKKIFNLNYKNYSISFRTELWKKH